MYSLIDELPCHRSSNWSNGSIPGQGSLEKPLDTRVAEYSVTGPTRREACGSIYKALLDRGMVITGLVQTGILRTRQRSTQVNRRGLRSANKIQRA